MSRVSRNVFAALVLALCAGAYSPCSADTPLVATATAASYADAIRTINPHVGRLQSRAYATALLRDSHALHVDPRLVMAVVTVESHWNATAVSIHGAEGLGQLKPGTARELGVEPFSGRANLHGVTLYLHRLLSLFSNSRYALREAIAGYNAGPYAVKSYGGIPPRPQTQHYVVKVLAAWRTFERRLTAHSTLTAATALEPLHELEKAQAAYWGVR